MKGLPGLSWDQVPKATGRWRVLEKMGIFPGTVVDVSAVPGKWEGPHIVVKVTATGRVIVKGAKRRFAPEAVRLHA